MARDEEQSIQQRMAAWERGDYAEAVLGIRPFVLNEAIEMRAAGTYAWLPDYMPADEKRRLIADSLALRARRAALLGVDAAGWPLRDNPEACE